MTINQLQGFELEELQTMAGVLMEDIAGCPEGPTERLEDLLDVLYVAASKATDTAQLKEDITFVHAVMRAENPVAALEDNCYMYAHRTEQGMTERVRAYLDNIVKCPKKIKLRK